MMVGCLSRTGRMTCQGKRASVINSSKSSLAVTHVSVTTPGLLSSNSWNMTSVNSARWARTWIPRSAIRPESAV